MDTEFLAERVKWNRSLEAFRAKVEADQLAELVRKGYDPHVHNYAATVKEGKKYAKVDVGSSGKFMVVMATGEIFGIKAYGVIHKGKRYGTLGTINDWFWGDYSPRKAPANPSSYSSCPCCSDTNRKNYVQGTRAMAGIYECLGCGGVYGDGTRSTLSQIVTLAFHKGQENPDNMQYFDFTFTDDRNRVHGWFDRDSRQVVQFG